MRYMFKWVDIRVSGKHKKKDKNAPTGSIKQTIAVQKMYTLVRANLKDKQLL